MTNADHDEQRRHAGGRRIAVHIGYHKTATSWLQTRFLPGHPAVEPYLRDGRARDDPFLKYLVATPERSFSPHRARDLFEAGLENVPAGASVVVLSAERLSGHPFTGGHDSLLLADRLAGVLPEAQVFWVVRNQIDMVESVYKQLVGEGYPGRISDLFDDHRWKSVRFDLGNYEYDWLTCRYQERFGLERVRVLTYEELTADRDAFLARICDFLRIPMVALPRADDVIHRSFPNRGIGVARALNHVRRSELNPFPPFHIGSWWRTGLAAMMRRLPERATLLTAAQEAALRDRFRDSNLRLVERAGGDFRLFLERMDTPRSPRPAAVRKAVV